MTRDDALEALRRLRPALEARGVAHASLFGSVARDSARPGSDVDVFLIPAPDAAFDLVTLGGLHDVLATAFDGAHVDIVVAPVKKAALAASISRERSDAF